MGYVENSSLIHSNPLNSYPRSPKVIEEYLQMLIKRNQI